MVPRKLIVSVDLACKSGPARRQISKKPSLIFGRRRIHQAKTFCCLISATFWLSTNFEDFDCARLASNLRRDNVGFSIILLLMNGR